jgi:hypothetical protein
LSTTVIPVTVSYALYVLRCGGWAYRMIGSTTILSFPIAVDLLT